MAKDPAMLWYWNDWNGGTMTLSRHLKGCYIDLLSAQFNSGPLSLDQIKTVLGTDKAHWDILSKKFRKEVNSDGIEVFFNERMETEKGKRAEFSNKQKERVLKRWNKDTTVNTTVLPKKENTNENEDQEEEKGVGKGEGFLCNDLDKKMELTRLEISAVIEFISIVRQKVLNENDVKNYWKAFKLDNFSKKEWYSSHEKLLSHFRHSLKNELNGKNQKIESNHELSAAGQKITEERSRKTISGN